MRGKRKVVGSDPWGCKHWVKFGRIRLTGCREYIHGFWFDGSSCGLAMSSNYTCLIWVEEFEGDAAGIQIEKSWRWATKIDK